MANNNKKDQNKAGKGKSGGDKTLASLCNSSNLAYRNYLGDVHTVVMNVVNKDTAVEEKKIMNITHISMPFGSQREKLVRAYFDLEDGEMQELYGHLGKCVSNQVSTSAFLTKRGVDSVCRYLQHQIVNKTIGKGLDLYLVTEYLRPVQQVYFNGQTTLRDIFNFGTRTAKLIKDVHTASEFPVTLRVIDHEQIFVDDKGKFVFGTFQYAYSPEMKRGIIPLAVTAPLHVEGRVSTGSAGDIGTDMYSLASILWSLLNGDGFDRPTPTGTPPQYATPEMVEILELGLTGDPEMFSVFKKGLYAIMKALNKDRDLGSTVIPVYMAEPCVPAPEKTLDIGVLVDLTKEQPAEPVQPVAEAVPEETKAPAAPVEEIAPEPVSEPAEPIPEVVEETPVEPEPEVIEPEVDEPKEPAAEGSGVVILEKEEKAPTEAVPAEPEQQPEPEAEAPAEAEKKPMLVIGGEQAPEAVSEPVAEPEAPESVAVDEEPEEDPQYLSVLDTSQYVEENDAVCDIEPESPEELMSFVVNYNKPKFFFQQVFVFLVIVAVIAIILYLSVKSHMISLW